MKTKRIIVFFLLFAFLIVSCGKDGIAGRDGRDGDVYVALDWVGTVSYTDDIPGTPTPTSISSEHYYRITPGVYTFKYVHNTLNPDVEWTYTYNYAAELGTPGTSGTEGGLFADGEDGIDGIDGRDLYYVIGLWSDGPEVYVFDYPYQSTDKSKPSTKKIENKLSKEKSLLRGDNESCLLVKK